MYGSKSVVKYPRCSIRRQSTFADAEVISFSARFWIKLFFCDLVVLECDSTFMLVYLSCLRTSCSALNKFLERVARDLKCLVSLFGCDFASYSFHIPNVIPPFSMSFQIGYMHFHFLTQRKENKGEKVWKFN